MHDGAQAISAPPPPPPQPPQPQPPQQQPVGGDFSVAPPLEDALATMLRGASAARRGRRGAKYEVIVSAP